MIEGRNQKLLRSRSHILGKWAKKLRIILGALSGILSSVHFTFVPHKWQDGFDQACPGDVAWGLLQGFHTQAPGAFSQASKQHQHHDDDENGADDTNTTMSKAVTIPAKATAETAEKENDENDDKDSAQ